MRAWFPPSDPPYRLCLYAGSASFPGVNQVRLLGPNLLRKSASYTPTSAQAACFGRRFSSHSRPSFSTRKCATLCCRRYFVLPVRQAFGALAHQNSFFLIETLSTHRFESNWVLLPHQSRRRSIARGGLLRLSRPAFTLKKSSRCTHTFRRRADLPARDELIRGVASADMREAHGKRLCAWLYNRSKGPGFSEPMERMALRVGNLPLGQIAIRRFCAASQPESCPALSCGEDIATRRPPRRPVTARSKCRAPLCSTEKRTR